jgi:predicted tellurium resistance membrane protein TerC
VLLVIGLGVSIPLIIYGSTLILKLMNRFPIIITIGAALLGWVAGEMAFSDPAIGAWAENHHNLHLIPPMLCALLVVAAGKFMQGKNKQA